MPVRGELVPGPGRFEIEVLDADPRRVKRLKIYRIQDQPGVTGPGRARRPGETGQTSAPANPPSPSDLPITHDASVKLSPDAPSKSTRRP